MSVSRGDGANAEQGARPGPGEDPLAQLAGPELRTRRSRRARRAGCAQRPAWPGPSSETKSPKVEARAKPTANNTLQPPTNRPHSTWDASVARALTPTRKSALGRGCMPALWAGRSSRKPRRSPPAWARRPRSTGTKRARPKTGWLTWWSVLCLSTGRRTRRPGRRRAATSATLTKSTTTSKITANSR